MSSLKIFILAFKVEVKFSLSLLFWFPLVKSICKSEMLKPKVVIMDGTVSFLSSILSLSNQVNRPLGLLFFLDRLTLQHYVLMHLFVPDSTGRTDVCFPVVAAYVLCQSEIDHVNFLLNRLTEMLITSFDMQKFYF